MRKAHDEGEKVFLAALILGDRLGFKSFQIASDTILLLDSEAICNKALEEKDDVHRCYVTFVSVFTEYAGYHDAGLLKIFGGDRSEGEIEVITVLTSPKLYKAAASIEVLL